MKTSKRLIINADDYGICREVNAAVEQLAMANSLGGVSVLANGECWAQAVDFLRLHPGLSAGIHLNAVEGLPIADSPSVKAIVGKHGSFVGVGTLLKRWMIHPVAVSRAIETEWRAQIERILRSNVRLTHADSHQHLHAFPPAYRCAVRLCDEYRIPALRRPCECGTKPMRQLSSFALRTSISIARAITPRTALRHNDRFLGFRRAGAYAIAEMIEDLQMTSDGLIEVALHPSIEDGIPYQHFSGDRERRALLDASLFDEIRRLGIELTTWNTITR
jgi:predicted glycoside hydrolase/deacetylase ChbG (UPF0249 family)